MATLKKVSLTVGFPPGIGNEKFTEAAEVKGPAIDTHMPHRIYLHLIRILSVR